MLLLRACLNAEHDAARAAAEWLRMYWRQGRLAPELDAGSRRLLPLFYHAAGAYLPARPKETLRRIHLDYWGGNQLRMLNLESALRSFAKRGIPTVVLKGAALATLYYPNLALRPMDDFDILIPEDAARGAIRDLIREGWSTDWNPPAMIECQYFFRYRQSLGFTHPGSGAMDLHWHVLHAATFRGADRDFWEGSVPLQILSASTRALCPTDALLHLLVHGDEADPVPGIRWIADAHMLLRKQPMDWRRLVRIAVDLRVTVPAARTLAFLRENFCPEIPPDVPRELEAAPVDAREQKLFDFLAGRALLNRLETLGYIFEWHRRATRDLPPWRSAALLPRQFQCYWHLPSMTRIPAHLLKLAVRKPTPTPLVHPPDFVRE